MLPLYVAILSKQSCCSWKIKAVNSHKSGAGYKQKAKLSGSILLSL